MSKETRFNGGEIVRLRRDHPEDSLVSGECGLIWGVYDHDPILYEASFVDKSGKFVDMRFYEEEVEEVRNPEEVLHIDRLEELRRMLER